MFKIGNIFNSLIKEQYFNENLRFNDGRFNKSGANTIYMGDEPIVDFGVAQIGEIEVNGTIFPNAMFLKGGYNAAVQKRGYGTIGINFIFNKLPKIQNLIIQCYKTACPFWEKIGGKVAYIDTKINKAQPIKTIVINRNDFMNGYGSKLNSGMNEEISASEAYDDKGAISTLVKKKRNLAFLARLPERVHRTLIRKGLERVRVPSSPHNAYIYYWPEAEHEAIELRDLAEKYEGYLPSTAKRASREDIIRIGQLLGYKQSDVDDFVNSKFGAPVNKI